MPEAFIIDAVRTPVGRRGGGLAAAHPADLGGHVIRALLAPLRPGGRITAALASQISDGAAALLIASSRAIREHGLLPRARIAHLSARGDDPALMLTRCRPRAPPSVRTNEFIPNGPWSSRPGMFQPRS
jgi:acetyl-CoA acetyltransferase